jgi:hypothetical protein
MPQMERARGVCRDELHHDGLPTSRLLPAERPIPCQDLREDSRHRSRREMEVEESGTRHLHPLHTGLLQIQHADDVLSDVPRRPTETGSQG